MAGFQFDFLTCSKLNLHHKKSGNEFILLRKKNISFNLLNYTLYTEDNNEIGSIYADYGANPYCEENPSHQTVSENWYSIDRMIINTEYQNLSLGTALVYLIVKEVQINSGLFLHVPLPAPPVLPFYLSCGFFPEPETVTALLKNQPYKLENHILQRRSYPIWRGATSILNANLHPKFVKNMEIFF
ncbi:GNAT family N-acetyltransferase [Endozoicomonas gorgoniicola]|uniref:GNAT family N-acetyltransferase n=1 Tax=Endozoicomonas gorgoniicola TaxID=1234144 RepID=A0ABT3MUM0_9GAMM|nr:GNAT family N-acetyltransferase [Endozoicomonas gorgoniicola]MCW7553054.1 GNAT family N-acetyltransferase [Endozoicomonas gorgoniicola]